MARSLLVVHGVRTTHARCGRRPVVGLSEFGFNPISLFSFSTDFHTKSKVNVSEGVLVGSIGSQGPTHNKETAHRDVAAA